MRQLASVPNQCLLAANANSQPPSPIYVKVLGGNKSILAIWPLKIHKHFRSWDVFLQQPSGKVQSEKGVSLGKVSFLNEYTYSVVF